MIAAEKSLYFFKYIDALVVSYIVEKRYAVTESMRILVKKEKPLEIFGLWEFIT
jgi:hypothetical protein